MPRILVIDDDSNVRTVVRKVLQRLGHDVTEVERVSEGLSALDEGSYDVLITDLHLPGAGGMTAVAHARRHFPHVKVLLVSGSIGPDAHPEGEGLEPDMVLAKPFDVFELGQAVDAVLGVAEGSSK